MFVKLVSDFLGALSPRKALSMSWSNGPFLGFLLTQTVLVETRSTHFSESWLQYFHFLSCVFTMGDCMPAFTTPPDLSRRDHVAVDLDVG